MFRVVKAIGCFVYRRVFDRRESANAAQSSQGSAKVDGERLARELFDLPEPLPQRRFRELVWWRKAIIISQLVMALGVLVFLMQTLAPLAIGVAPGVRGLFGQALEYVSLPRRSQGEDLDERLLTSLDLDTVVYTESPGKPFEKLPFNGGPQLSAGPSVVTLPREPRPDMLMAVPEPEQPAATSSLDNKRRERLEQKLEELVGEPFRTQEEGETGSPSELRKSAPAISWEVSKEKTSGKEEEQAIGVSPYQWADLSLRNKAPGYDFFRGQEQVQLPRKESLPQNEVPAATAVLPSPPGLFFNPEMFRWMGRTWWVVRVEKAQHFFPLVPQPLNASWVYFGESAEAVPNSYGWSGKDRAGYQWFKALVVWKTQVPYREGQQGELQGFLSLFE